MFVFFVKQKTAYEMRISDWSSDVCSSDLACRDISAKVMVTPALTAARMPEAWTCSASRYEPNGISRLTRICEPVSSPQRFVTHALARVTDSVTATPVASPIPATHRKLSAAAPAEKVPVSAAAMAKRRQTRPEASFKIGRAHVGTPVTNEEH